MRNDNGIAISLSDYETPFADDMITSEVEQPSAKSNHQHFSSDFESPFARTYESDGQGPVSKVHAEAFVELLGELQHEDFTNALYEVANEIEETILSKFSDESSNNGQYTQYVQQRAYEYFVPLENEINGVIDKVNAYLTQNETESEAEIEGFLNELEFDHVGQLTPAQEELFEGFLKKIKSVVKKGVSAAKKVANVAKKLSPIHIALDKIKGLVKPMLNKVLNSLIGKIPQNLQPYAQTLAKKLLNLETAFDDAQHENLAGANFEMFQRELDLNIANLVFSEDELESEELINHFIYESESETNTFKAKHPLIKYARRKFIKRLKGGEDLKPALEEFVPAIYPAVKLAISIIGRKRVIDFLAGMIAKLVEKYVPANVSKPLAASIVDLGLGAMGFETAERDDDTLAYEAIANTVEEVIHTLATDSELEKVSSLPDEKAMELLTERALPAFNKAVANNFPGTMVKKALQASREPGVWILMPRGGAEQSYKKFSRVYPVTLTQQMAASVNTFGDLPLSQFLKDTLAIDLSTPVQARVHLYEAIQDTWLSKISMHERVPGLGSADERAWKQIHPLSVQAATSIINDSGLGKNVDPTFTNTHHKIAPGQRFFYLEIPGLSVRRPTIVNGKHKHSGSTNTEQITARTGDVQAVLNFIRSEVTVNYFFSENDADQVVEKLNRNDWIGAAEGIRKSLRETLNGIVLKNVGSKVKIIHEAVPEIYLQYIPEQEEFIGRAAGKLMGSVGKAALKKLVEKLTEKFADAAYEAVKNFFKARVAEFKEELAKPEDGVTIRISWANVPGMAQVRTVIKLVRGEGSLGDLKNISFPSIPAPSLKTMAGKHFM